jgi:adenosylcobinamide-phosphate synthase
MTSLITFLAYLLDRILGDPQSWPHPVRFIGSAIAFIERHTMRILVKIKAPAGGFVFGGALMGLLVIGLSGFSAWFCLWAASSISPVLWFFTVLYLTYAAFCLHDLIKHVKNVEKALHKSDLIGARRALSWIVGRDTGGLDGCAVRRASIETLAENFSDGLVAPLFYLSVGGPVLAWVYKAINTLDSMVGYKNERFLYLGRFCARLDDAANYLPARLAALALILTARLLGYDGRKAYLTFRQEGRFHSSPNSGQTEAAMAGALDVFLGGSSTYGGQVVAKPIIHQSGAEATQEAVTKALLMVKTATALTLGLAIVVESLFFIFEVTPWGWGLDF